MLGAVLGGIAGLLTGGTAMAAAVGAGLGRIASGGDLEDALKLLKMLLYQFLFLRLF